MERRDFEEGLNKERKLNEKREGRTRIEKRRQNKVEIERGPEGGRCSWLKRK